MTTIIEEQGKTDNLFNNSSKERLSNGKFFICQICLYVFVSTPFVQEPPIDYGKI